MRRLLFSSLCLAILVLTVVLAGCTTDNGEPIKKTDVPPVAAGTWPQYRSEVTHAGVAPPGTTVGPGIALYWNSTPLAIGTYTASKSSPTVDEKYIYIGVDDGQLYALNKTNGEIVWSFKTHKYFKEMNQTDPNHRGIHGTACYDEEYVYVGDYSGYNYCLDKETGTLVWENKLGGSIGASPVLYNEYLFTAVEFPTPNGKIFVQNKSDGSVVWETEYLGNHPHSSVTIDPTRGYCFVGANNGYFFCFDFVNKEQVWKYKTGGEIKSTAAVAGDLVYITSWDYKLHAFWIENGTQHFTFSTKERTMSSPSVWDGKVYFGSHDDILYCINAFTGEKYWSYKTGGSITSSPTVVGDTGVVLIGSKDRKVHMLDARDGEHLWSYETTGWVTSVPTATGNALYVFDDKGRVWCFTMPE